MQVKFHLENYFTSGGLCPVAEWLDSLDGKTVSRITLYLDRLENGNVSSLKTVGHGVYEMKMDFGPGYRIYLGREGYRLIILLYGGSKQRQQKDIQRAKDYWQDYKNRKKGA